MFTIRLQRLQNNVIKNCVATCCTKINTTNQPHQLPITTQLLNQRRVQQFSPHISTIKYYTTITQQEATLDALEFENIVEETLEGLTEYFEELVELDATIKEADISYSSGVLSVTIDEAGTYVINKQTPNKQIWLSSPTSGPKRFDFNIQEQCWVYKHSGETLHQILQAEMPKIFKLKNIDFSKCCFSKL